MPGFPFSCFKNLVQRQFISLLNPLRITVVAALHHICTPVVAAFGIA